MSGSAVTLSTGHDLTPPHSDGEADGASGALRGDDGCGADGQSWQVGDLLQTTGGLAGWSLKYATSSTGVRVLCLTEMDLWPKDTLALVFEINSMPDLRDQYRLQRADGAFISVRKEELVKRCRRVS
jgi:hypothetical protein